MNIFKIMKLEKGKFYRTRSGEKVECLTTDIKTGNEECLCLFENGNFETYHINGRFYSDEESECDIISEWSDVVIPWEDYPRWCNWVAMDRNGKWCGYFEEPFTMTSFWMGCSDIIRIPSEYAPKGFKGNWKESKFERPKKD